MLFRKKETPWTEREFIEAKNYGVKMLNNYNMAVATLEKWLMKGEIEKKGDNDIKQKPDGGNIYKSLMGPKIKKKLNRS